jgi:hypothetical protein
MKTEVKDENVLHRIMIAPFLRLMDWMSGRQVVAKRPAGSRNR